MTASSAAAVPTAPVTGRAGVLRGRWRAGRPPSAAGRYPRWSRWAWVTATAPTSAASQGSPRRSSHRSHSAQEAEQSGPDVRFPALRRARFVHGPDGLLIGGFGPDGAVRPWPARGVCGVLEVTGRTRKDAEKRLAAVHRAIRIREKRVGSFPALARAPSALSRAAATRWRTSSASTRSARCPTVEATGSDSPRPCEVSAPSAAYATRRPGRRPSVSVPRRRLRPGRADASCPPAAAPRCPVRGCGRGGSDGRGRAPARRPAPRSPVAGRAPLGPLRWFLSLRLPGPGSGSGSGQTCARPAYRPRTPGAAARGSAFSRAAPGWSSCPSSSRAPRS